MDFLKFLTFFPVYLSHFRYIHHNSLTMLLFSFIFFSDILLLLNIIHNIFFQVYYLSLFFLIKYFNLHFLELLPLFSTYLLHFDHIHHNPLKDAAPLLCFLVVALLLFHILQNIFFPPIICFILSFRILSNIFFLKLLLLFSAYFLHFYPTHNNTLNSADLSPSLFLIFSCQLLFLNINIQYTRKGLVHNFLLFRPS